MISTSIIRLIKKPIAHILGAMPYIEMFIISSLSEISHVCLEIWIKCPYLGFWFAFEFRTYGHRVCVLWRAYCQPKLATFSYLKNNAPNMGFKLVTRIIFIPLSGHISIKTALMESYHIVEVSNWQAHFFIWFSIKKCGKIKWWFYNPVFI